MRNLVVAASAVALCAALGHPIAVLAGSVPCREVYGTGGGYVCGADVESRLFDAAFSPAQTQTASWAVSMAMIIAYSGGEITQNDILSSVFGTQVPPTLSSSQAIGYSTHSFSGAHNAVADTVASVLLSAPLKGSRGALRAIAGQLQADTPLLVFTSRNAMLLTRIYYHADLFGHPTALYAAVVRDPFAQAGAVPTTGVKLDGYPGQRFMTEAEYDDIQSVVQVSVKNH
ncbi:MAG: hypothetical protein JO219_05340 [Candidatus Eremiobacteraeota bacterium]|nr:hypothetical protein [Candidatus Eremiobacteraeota bacterium]MBV8365143.1 hypothetical protein [Candidatus Eremiobacteraeota bacterium]